MKYFYHPSSVSGNFSGGIKKNICLKIFVEQAFCLLLEETNSEKLPAGGAMKQDLIFTAKQQQKANQKQKREKQPTFHVVIGRFFGEFSTTYSLPLISAIIQKNLVNTASLGNCRI